MRAAVMAAGLMLVLLLGWRLAGGFEPRFEPLFADLEPADAAAIVDRLEEQRVPYRLANGGRDVLVPADQVHRLRLEFAGQGLPTGGLLGFELFDETRFGDTEFDRRVRLLRALQGELARTIEELEGVESARVHIVLPEESLFLSEQRPASAAVLLELRPGVDLSAEQIRALVNLVAGSVEGLEPSGVTVVDARGRVLSDRAMVQQEQELPGAVSGLTLQRQVEEHLQDELTSLLEQVLGPGNVVARVAAELDLDRVTVEREVFEPSDGEGLLRSVQELRERFEGTGATVGGVPGPETDTTPSYPLAVPGSEGTYEREEALRNYEVNRTTETRVVAPGAIRRLSVSVVVNRALTPDQEQAIRATVEAAIGYDPQRQDQVAVIGMPFDTSLADQLREELNREQAARQAWRTWAIPVAAAVVAVAGAAAWVVVTRRRMQRQLAALEEELARRAELERRRVVEVPEAVSANGSGTGNGKVASPMETELDQAARQQPEVVARVLRVWLAEE